MTSGSYPFVVEEHASEAAFQWLLRDAAVRQPHFALRHLATLDGQLEAQLDGLRLSGAYGWEVCREALALGEPGEVFAAAILAFESGDASRIGAVLEVAGSEPELARPAVSALGWLPFDQARPHVMELLRERSAGLARIGLAAAAVHRADPGPALGNALGADDTALQSRALRAVGELGRVDLLPQTERHLDAENGALRFAAAWSAAVLSGRPRPLSALAAIAESGGPRPELALETVMRRADPGAAETWRRRLALEAGTLRLAVQGAGAIGDPSVVPELLERMRAPELARLAGEAFSMITGVDIAYEDLEGERPEGIEPGPTEDPEDENVELDPDEYLPWPDAALVERWWNSHRQRFQTGTRYLVGKPTTPDWCRQVLRDGYQRQRAAAALELAMHQPGTPLFEVRAPGFRQQRPPGR